MNNKLIVLCLPLSVSLISASSSNFVYVNSKIRHQDIYCKKQIISYSNKQITTLSNVLKKPVASLTFNYEMYQMYKPTELQTNYHPGYILLYQADVYVNNAVEYKGGVGNWFNGKHAGFLNYIDFNAEFRDIDYTDHSYQCPVSYSKDQLELSKYRYLKEVNPNDIRYTHDSADFDKQTQYNSVIGILDSYDGDKFQDSTCLFTNSYFNSYMEFFKNTDLINGSNFDSRLLAYYTDGITISEAKDLIKFHQRFQYNYKVTRKSKKENGTEVYYPELESDKDHLFSGPCTNGNDDKQPFNFTFYGCFAFESSKLPSIVSIDLSMDTFHGSHVVFDKFESSASGSILLHLK